MANNIEIPSTTVTAPRKAKSSPKVTKEMAIVALKRRREAKAATEGWQGIANDVGQSIAGVPSAAVRMLPEMVEGATGAAKNIVQHPLRSFLNAGAGLGEGAIAMEHIPANIAQYLADKGLMSQKDAETYQKYKIPNLGIEKALGIEEGDKGDEFIKMLTSFLTPAKMAKMAKTGKAAVPVAASALATGENQDPLQAAMLAYIVEHAAKKGMAKIKGIPNAVNKAAGVEPPPPPSPPGGAGGSPSASMQGAMPAPMNAGFPLPSPLPIQPVAQAPAGIPWKAQLPDSVSWMKNIPQAALNVAKEVPANVKNVTGKIPEVAGSALATGLEKFADVMPEKLQGIAQPTLGALASRIKHYSVPPEEMAQRKILGDLKEEHLPMIQERVAAANRLDLPYLSPAEAALSTFEAEKQGGIGKTSAGSQELYRKGAERAVSEVNASRRFLDTIYNDAELAPEKKAAYEETMKGRVPHEFIVEKQKLPVIEDAIKKIQSDAAYRQIIERELGVKLKDVNPKTFQYWDIVKRVLYDMEEGKRSKIGKATTRSREIANTRKSMVREMDAIKPEYSNARKISERQQVRNELEHYFDKRPMTLNNWHKYLSSSSKYENLVHKLEGNPEATQMLHDIHLLGGDIIPNTMTIREATKLKRTGMSTPRNKLEAMKQAFDEEYGKEHDVEAVKLMTSKHWPDILAKNLTEKRK